MPTVPRPIAFVRPYGDVGHAIVRYRAGPGFGGITSQGERVQIIDGNVVLSPTDLTRHLACPHATSLELAAAAGTIERPPDVDDTFALVTERGHAHETEYLAMLRAQGRSVVEIETTLDRAGRIDAERRTLDAMRTGVDVVYQATFFDELWGGQADFLLRVGVPSALGEWSYEIADTKLARSLKAPALTQMAVYAERLALLQGVAPDRLHVITGDGQEHPFRLIDVAAFTRRAQRRLRSFVEERPVTEARPVPHCALCRWHSRCDDEWRRADDLSLVAFMRSDHRERLLGHGITTVVALATATLGALPSDIPRASRERLVQQAAEQFRERETGEPSYLLLAPVPDAGLLTLPPPSDGDLYLDFEGDPFAEGGDGLVYLAGVSGRDGAVTGLWAHDRAAERALTVALIDLLAARWRAFPDMHVYHYAAYEESTLKRLTMLHGVGESELDALLRAERFVDLYAVVRQSMRISKPSYSLKQVEALYWPAARDDGSVGDAMASVVAYERWRSDHDDTRLGAIADYNRTDVVSLTKLHEWLERRRQELGERFGAQPRPAPAVPGTENDGGTAERERAEADLADRLRPEHPLLAELVLWHRREARPEWWEFYRIGKLDDDELVNDRAALGPLSAPVDVGKEKLSRLWRYEFEPQDTQVRLGQPVFDDRDHANAGTVFQIDAVAGFVVVKRKGEPKLSRAFTPPGPVNDDVLRRAVAAAAEAALAGRPTLAGTLLARDVPRDTAPRPGESASDAVLRLGRSLDGDVLAVQGPPGSGKTTAAAALIRALLDDGKRVGVTATSHAVISKLLVEVGRPGVQKCDKEQHCGSSAVSRVGSPSGVASVLAAGEVALAGGTPWLWAATELASAVDVLVIDEAGQFSLANAVAAAQGARSLVLFGDPQQLAQPSRGTHPNGAGVSALEHLLDGHDTIPEDRGVFLDTSWRMHPDITRFVSDLAYEGRLECDPATSRQLVHEGGAVHGSGLEVRLVEHVARSSRSPEEAAVVAGIWRSLQGVRFDDRDGVTAVLGSEDVLIVAPYNNQVAAILDLIPGARVGTVDKFQGQQAPVVLYSMTSSTAEDAPRGTDFLYDLHRLNVAVSRAQALAVVVMSEALLDAPVRSPAQLRRVNALCRLAEEASSPP